MYIYYSSQIEFALPVPYVKPGFKNCVLVYTKRYFLGNKVSLIFILYGKTGCKINIFSTTDYCGVQKLRSRVDETLLFEKLGFMINRCFKMPQHLNSRYFVVLKMLTSHPVLPCKMKINETSLFKNERFVYTKRYVLKSASL